MNRYSLDFWHRAENSLPISLEEGLGALGKPLFLVKTSSGTACFDSGSVFSGNPGKTSACPILALVPPLLPENLGNPDFLKQHGLRFPYLAGAMAHGISSEKLVIEMGRFGGMGFFGAGGCSPERIEKSIETIEKATREEPFPHGFNFLHNPRDPEDEMALCTLYLEREIRTICAAAFVRITHALVMYRLHGAKRDESGRPVPKNRILAKVSRAEIAELFLEPPPEKLVASLLSMGKISPLEAALSQEISMADAITAEADSGGHTDNRPPLVLFSVIKNLKNRIQEKRKYHEIPSVGVAGGIATPESCAAAFSMGADYVLVGSVHQACVESGTSFLVKEMLSGCDMTDFAMAPSADTFEIGARVQVLKKGSMFALRAKKLAHLYQDYENLEALPEQDIQFLEEKIFKEELSSAWRDVHSFWEKRDPRQNLRAEKDPKHKMALLFRSYLGLSPLWAIEGNLSRKQDFQVWSGPAMGAFNDWTRESFLGHPEKRTIRLVAGNLLAGAAVRLRYFMLQSQVPGIHVDPVIFRPMDAASLEKSMKIFEKS